MCEFLKLPNGIKIFNNPLAESYLVVMKFRYTSKNISYLTNTLHLLEHLFLSNYSSTLYLVNKINGMTFYNYLIVEIYNKENSIDDIKDFFRFIFNKNSINVYFDPLVLQQEVNTINNEMYQRENLCSIQDDMVSALLNINGRKYFEICELNNHQNYLYNIKNDLEDVCILFDGNSTMSIFLYNTLEHIKLNNIKENIDLGLKLDTYYIKSNIAGCNEFLYKINDTSINNYLGYIKKHKYEVPIIIDIGFDKYIVLSITDCGSNLYNNICNRYCYSGNVSKEFFLTPFYISYLMSIEYDGEKLETDELPDDNNLLNIDKKTGIVSTHKYHLVLNSKEDIIETDKETIKYYFSDKFDYSKNITIRKYDKALDVYFDNMYDQLNTYKLSELLELVSYGKFNKLNLYQKNLSYLQLLEILQAGILLNCEIKTNEEQIIITRTKKEYDIYDIVPGEEIYIYSPFSFIVLVENKKRYHGSKYEKDILFSKYYNRFRRIGLYGFFCNFGDNNVVGFSILTNFQNVKEIKQFIRNNFYDYSLVISKPSKYVIINNLFKRKIIQSKDIFK